jgi:Divergent CRAL/TRIO domain
MNDTAFSTWNLIAQFLFCLGCIHLGTDEHDVPLIVCIPRIGFDKHTVSEAEIKKMFLLFIRMADALIRTPFSIVYAHDGAQYWLQRQPIVFRFYKLLPRKLKRNLESMYIIHPNVGIKSFFAFSRVFLSKKFYEKLTYVENIFDFQKVISPMCLSLPYNYLLIEDEELALSSCGVTASLIDTYDPNLKSTRLLNSCVNYLRQFGLESTGDVML